jgi:hypothetical protein
MIVQNTTKGFKLINGKLVRAWRTIIVPDDYQIKEGEGIVSLSEKEENVSESKIDYDLNGDGVFDDKDKSIAGKVLATNRKRKLNKGEY